MKLTCGVVGEMSHDAEHDEDKEARPGQIDDPPQKGKPSYDAFVNTLFQPLRCAQAHWASTHVVDDVKSEHALKFVCGHGIVCKITLAATVTTACTRQTSIELLTAKMICMTSSDAEARSFVALASTKYFVLASTLLNTSSSCKDTQVSVCSRAIPRTRFTCLRGAALAKYS